MIVSWLKRCIRRWQGRRENARALKTAKRHYRKVMEENPGVSHNEALRLSAERWQRELDSKRR